MVEDGETVTHRVSACLGTVAEDYVTRGSTGEPLLEICHGLLFDVPLFRSFHLDVVRKPLWDQSWSFDLGCGPQESGVPEGHSFRDEWFLIQMSLLSDVLCLMWRSELPRVPGCAGVERSLVGCPLLSREVLMDLSST